MSNGAALSPTRQSRVADIIGVKTNRVTKQAEEVDSREANVSSNAFFKIIFDPAATPEEKQSQVAQALSTIGTKEENRERVKQFEEFKEYLQAQRENMAKKIIELTNTETFAQLQSVYNSMNMGMIEFNEAMGPILAIVDAMHTVRKEGKTNDLFKEILEDRRDETEFKAKIDEIKGKFETTSQLINDLNLENARLVEEKSFFGFGGTTQAARAQIAANEVTIETLKSDLIKIETDLAALNEEAKKVVAADTDFAKAKATIRNMLDLSAADHKANQEKTVEKALNFVTTSKKSLGEVRDHLVQMNSQVDNLGDANQTITQVYAILGEGLKDAEKVNRENREALNKAEAEESMIAKMKRDSDLRVLDEHLTLLSTSAVDTETTFADLSSQSVRINTMKSANANQMDKVRKLHTQGVAGVADRLSVVLQAVGQAALGESSAIAKDTLIQMTNETNKVAQMEAMRAAVATGEVNEDLVRAMEDLGAYGEVVRAATDITRENITEMRQNLDSLKDIANSLQDDIKEGVAVYGEAGAPVKKEQAQVAPVTSNPFKL